MTYQWDFSFLLDHVDLLVRGFVNTILLFAVCMAVGMVLGLIAGMSRVSQYFAVRAAASLYTELFRNVPALVLLFWFYYAIPVLTGWQSSAFVAALIALSLYTGAYSAEIYRAGIESVEKGQWEASRALGMTRMQQFRYVVVPQAMRRMIPAFTNRAIELAKATTLASTISFAELLYNARLIAEYKYRPLETYTALALLFAAIILPLSYLTIRMEKRMRANEERN